MSIPRARLQGHRQRSERGSVTLEMVVLLPLLFLLLLAGLQAAMIHHARAIAIGAAQEGVRAAASENGTVAAGVAAAHSFATEVGRDALGSVDVTGERTAVAATISVSGTSLTVIPGWDPTVVQSATLPVERVT